MTRKTLVIALLIASMLSVTVGGTIAWFTDEVTSANNEIKAGNLDIEVYKDAVADENKIGKDTQVFDLPQLWEPGAVATAKLIVKNEGNLALNYKMSVIKGEENGVSDGTKEYKLSEALKIAYVTADLTGKSRAEVVAAAEKANPTNFASFSVADSLNKGEQDEGTLVVYWLPGANDNNWNANNGKEVTNFKGAEATALQIDLALKVEATQKTYEEDSFNDQYDNLATPVQVQDDAAMDRAIKDAEDGAAFSLASGNYSLPSLSGKKGIAIIGNPNGGTKMAAVNSFNFGEDTQIKNITFTTNGASSVRYGYTSGDVVYDNCVFEGKQYGYHVDNANGGTITFNNCTFYGRNAFAASGTYIFNNCTFKYTYSNYNTINIYSQATFNNCKWDSKLELYIEKGAKAIVDGEEITERTVFISDARAMESFQQAVNWRNNTYAGVTVMLSADIDMKDAYYSNWTPIGQTGATQFQGTFDGHGYTIKNLNIDSSKQTGEHYSSGLFGWLNNATVKNLTIENATVTGNHNVGVIAGYMETAGCTISNCHVVNATVVGKHANDDACGDKVGVIVGHAGNAGVKVENCTAKDSTVTAGRDAGQIVGAAKTENVINCSATNVTVTAGGDCTGANVNNAVIGRVL